MSLALKYVSSESTIDLRHLTLWSADSVWARLFGLLLTDTFPSHHLLMFVDCQSIHTWGMRYSIDVMGLDKEYRVVGLCQSLPPWRYLYLKKAKIMIEMKSGEIERLGIKKGQRMSLPLKPMTWIPSF